MSIKNTPLSLFALTATAAYSRVDTLLKRVGINMQEKGSVPRAARCNEGSPCCQGNSREQQQAEPSDLYPDIQKGGKESRKQIFRQNGQDKNLYFFQVKRIFHYFF